MNSELSENVTGISFIKRRKDEMLLKQEKSQHTGEICRRFKELPGISYLNGDHESKARENDDFATSDLISLGILSDSDSSGSDKLSSLQLQENCITTGDVIIPETGDDNSSERMVKELSIESNGNSTSDDSASDDSASDDSASNDSYQVIQVSPTWLPTFRLTSSISNNRIAINRFASFFSKWHIYFWNALKKPLNGNFNEKRLCLDSPIALPHALPGSQKQETELNLSRNSTCLENYPENIGNAQKELRRANNTSKDYNETISSLSRYPVKKQANIRFNIPFANSIDNVGDIVHEQNFFYVDKIPKKWDEMLPSLYEDSVRKQTDICWFHESIYNISNIFNLHNNFYDEKTLIECDEAYPSFSRGSLMKHVGACPNSQYPESTDHVTTAQKKCFYMNKTSEKYNKTFPSLLEESIRENRTTNPVFSFHESTDNVYNSSTRPNDFYVDKTSKEYDVTFPRLTKEPLRKQTQITTASQTTNTNKNALHLESKDNVSDSFMRPDNFYVEKTLKEYDATFPQLTHDTLRKQPAQITTVPQSANTNKKALLAESIDIAGSESLNFAGAVRKNQQQSSYLKEENNTLPNNIAEATSTNDNPNEDSLHWFKIRMLPIVASEAWNEQFDNFYLNYPLQYDCSGLFKGCWSVREDDAIETTAVSPFFWDFQIKK